MANDTTGNPWKIDTAGSLTTSPVYVKKMRFVPADDGDDLLIVNNAGDTVWETKAIAAGDNDLEIDYILDIEGWVNGLSVTTIDGSAVLYIFIR